MRFFTYLFALALSLLTLLPAAAKVYDVQVGANGNNYVPINFPPGGAINIGDQVRFVYVSGFHPTVSNSSPALFPPFTLSSSNTTYTTPALTQAGTFPYYCTVHAALDPSTGSYVGMIGSIRVSATTLAATPTQGTGPVLSYYPNPTRGPLTVQLAAAAGYSYKLRLSNVLGREVRLLALPPSVAAVDGIPLDLSGLPAGLYFCSLLVNDKAVSVSRLTVL